MKSKTKILTVLIFIFILLLTAFDIEDTRLKFGEVVLKDTCSGAMITDRIYLRDKLTVQNDITVNSSGWFNDTLEADILNSKLGLEMNGTNINTKGTLTNVMYKDSSNYLIGSITFNGATSDFKFVDGSNEGVTSDGWIELDVNGSIMYIRLYNDK